VIGRPFLDIGGGGRLSLFLSLGLSLSQNLPDEFKSISLDCTCTCKVWSVDRACCLPMSFL
jgi:hypothetical protein